MRYHKDLQTLPLPPCPRHFKKCIAAQIIGAILIVYIWFTVNGGFIPRFILPRLPNFTVGPEIGCLVYFNVDNDASKIQWARATNSMQAVKNQVSDPKVHMISADIILRGHGTKSQSLVPVMGKPPQTDSDITFKDWLQEVHFSGKGIRLHFHSMESVEISMQILHDFNKKNPIKYPVWLHADVLQGPLGEKPVINVHRYIKTIQRLFPKFTLSLGWTTGTHTDLSQTGYTWDMVWDMLDLVQEWQFTEQPIVFQGRLSLIHNSVPQLKWLFDNVKQSSFIIWHEGGDNVHHENIMYVAYRFPPHGVYFDLSHDRNQNVLDQYRHFSRDKVNYLVLKRDEVMFKTDGWLKMGFHQQKNSILPSTEAIILASPIVHIVTKSTYLPTSEIFIQGRVQFLNRNNVESIDSETGLNIYVRPVEYGHFDHIVAIRCFIGVSGEIEVSGSNLPEGTPDFRRTARVTTTHVNCFKFKIVDDKSQIIFYVKSLSDCTTLESVQDEDELHPLLIVQLPAELESSKRHPFVVKMHDVKRQAVIDEMSIKHKN